MHNRFSDLTTWQTINVLNMFADDIDIENIYRFISEDCERDKSKKTSLRTIYRWRKAYLDKEYLKTKDLAITWHNLDGIEGINLPVLRKINRWLTLTFSGGGSSLFRPTWRSIYWQNHVIRSTVPRDISSPYDIWILGELFAQRELHSEYFEEVMVIDDLEALLTYTPWSSQKHEYEYLSLVRKKEISGLISSLDVSLYTSNVFRCGLANILSHLINGKHHLLPSMQRQMYAATGRDLVVNLGMGDDSKPFTFGSPMGIEEVISDLEVPKIISNWINLSPEREMIEWRSVSNDYRRDPFAEYVEEERIFEEGKTSVHTIYR